MSTIAPQPCKNHPFYISTSRPNHDELSEDDEDVFSNEMTFPEYWYTSHIGGKISNAHDVHVQEMSAHLVYMTNKDWFHWSYTLTCIHEDLWHVYGIKYDLWDVAETQTTYYTRLEDSWERVLGYE